MSSAGPSEIQKFFINPPKKGVTGIREYILGVIMLLDERRVSYQDGRTIHMLVVDTLKDMPFPSERSVLDLQDCVENLYDAIVRMEGQEVITEPDNIEELPDKGMFPRAHPIGPPPVKPVEHLPEVDVQSLYEFIDKENNDENIIEWLQINEAPQTEYKSVEDEVKRIHHHWKKGKIYPLPLNEKIVLWQLTTRLFFIKRILDVSSDIDPFEGLTFLQDFLVEVSNLLDNVDYKDSEIVYQLAVKILEEKFPLKPLVLNIQNYIEDFHDKIMKKKIQENPEEPFPIKPEKASLHKEVKMRSLHEFVKKNSDNITEWLRDSGVQDADIVLAEEEMERIHHHWKKGKICPLISKKGVVPLWRLIARLLYAKRDNVLFNEEL